MCWAGIGDVAAGKSRSAGEARGVLEALSSDLAFLSGCWVELVAREKRQKSAMSELL